MRLKVAVASELRLTRDNKLKQKAMNIKKFSRELRKRVHKGERGI